MKKKYNVKIADAAEKIGVHVNTIYWRINQKGWSVEKATTTPAKQVTHKELPDRQVFQQEKEYKTFDESCMRHKKIYADEFPEKIKKVDKGENYSVGGWKIIFLNYVKKGECRFQAQNTDGRLYATNDPIEIHSILEEIFGNICDKFG